jgi:hypothetical protein
MTTRLTTASPAKHPVDPSAYNGRTPDGRFVKGNPGKPAGARDRTPRAPRFWNELTAKMGAGVVRFHVATQRYVLFNPATQEPLTDPDGNWIYDPTYGYVAAVAMLFGALHPQDGAKFTDYWEKYVKQSAAAKRREGSRRHRRLLTT